MGLKKHSICAVILLAVIVMLTVMPAASAGSVSINCKNSDVRDVLRGLGEQSGINVVIDPSVQGTVTMTLNNVAVETAMQAICDAAGLTFLHEGSIYRVVRINFTVTCENALLRVEARDADLSALWREIARKTGTNIIPDAAVNGKVSLVLTDLPVDRAVVVLAESTGATVEKREGIYYVHTSYAPSDKNIKVSYANGRISVEAQGADVAAVIRQLAVQTGVTVAADGNVAGTINAAIKDMPLADGLRLLFESNGLRLMQVDAAYYRVTRSDGFVFIKYENGKLTMDVRNADLRTVVDELSRKTQKNFLIDRDVTVRVSGSFRDIALAAGIQAFFESNGLKADRRGEAYLIGRMTEQRNINITLNEDGKLDIDVYTAPLNQALRELANRMQVNLVVCGTVNWLVNDVQLRGVTLDEALGHLLRGTSYTWRKTEGTYVVSDGVGLRPDSADFLEVAVITCHNLTAETVFNTLPPTLPQGNFRVIKEQNVLVITGAPEFIQRARDFVALIDRPGEEVTSEIIRINNMRAEDAFKLIPASMPKNDIQILKEANALVVTGTRASIEAIRAYCTKIDLPVPLILFDILVLQVSRDNSRAITPGFSVQYGNVMIKFGSGMTEISVVETPRVSATASLNTAIEKGLVEVMANPKIATLSGHQASFQVVTKSRYAIPSESSTTGGTTTTTQSTVQTVEAGIDLSLSPWVSADKQITLDIKPRISEYTTSMGGAAGAVALPTTNERSTDTTVRVRDGQSIIISGLIQKSTRKVVKKLPILGYIPLIGLLFQSTSTVTSESEFLILVTPHLIDDPAQMQQYMGQLGQVLNPPAEPAPAPQPPADATEPGQKEKPGRGN